MGEIFRHDAETLKQYGTGPLECLFVCPFLSQTRRSLLLLKSLLYPDIIFSSPFFTLYFGHLTMFMCKLSLI